MNQNLEINSDQINQMTKISTKEREFRIKNLKLFNETGFPNKRDEDWKFSDFREIVEKNFQKLDTTEISTKIKKINLIKDFEHNYVFLINGNLDSSNFKYEDKSKIKLSPINNDIEYQIIKNPLILGGTLFLSSTIESVISFISFALLLIKRPLHINAISL